MLRWNYCHSHYFSVDDILTTQEKVPCTFLKSVPQIDCLGPGSDNGGIQKNAIVEIPLWLVEELADEEYSIVKMEIPKIYKDIYRDILSADAAVVDLYKMSKFFYTFGKRLSDIDNTYSSQLSSLLIQTFKERFRQLLDWVQNMDADEVVTEKLDFLEHQLLVNGKTSQNKLHSWLSHGIGSVQAADSVLNHKKRKFDAVVI